MLRILLMAALVIGVGGFRPAVAQHLAFRLLDEDSGLSNGAVESMAQDSAGFLYAGTESGVFRYDGFHFIRMGARDGLPGNGYVEAVRTTSDGAVWVVFADRIYRSGDGATVSVGMDTRVEEDRALPAAVLDRDLLLVRENRLLRIHLEPDRTLSVRPVITAAMLARDPGRAALNAGIHGVHVENGVVWLGCGTAICRLDPDGVAVLGPSSGLPADRWIAFLRDHAGTLWLRSAGRIASRAAGAAVFTVIDVPGGPGRFAGDAAPLDLVEDGFGRVITQSARGLLMHQNGRWAGFERLENVAYDSIRTMLVDREGSLWVASSNHGAARMIGLGMFENWTRAQGLSDDVIWNAARDAGGRLWVATDLGVDALVERAPAPRIAGFPPAAKPDAASPPGTPDPLLHYPSRTFALLRSAQGSLWIGQRDGTLIRRDPRTGQSQLVAKLDLIRLIVADPTGSLWIATTHGLSRIDHPDAAVPTISAVIPGVGRVYAITFDHAGELWVLTEKTLLHRDAAQQFHAVLQTDPQGGYTTRSLAFAPDGTLWLGSFTSGITRLHLDHGVVVGRDRQPSGHIASQEIEMMHRDPSGLIWIGTDHGLDVTDGTRWQHLDDQDGLASNDVDENAMFTDDDGTSWFGTAGGLSHLIARRDPERSAALFSSGGRFGIVGLHPVVTAITAGTRELPAAEVKGGLIHLQWSNEPLVIGFASLDFRFEKTIRFRYRLRGVDRGWVETAAHEVRYPDPPWGRLVFEVMAVDPLRQLSSDPARITIKVHPPWWRIWPVSAGAVLLVVGGLVLLSRLRVSYLLVRQRQLEGLVVERTREIEQARLILFKQATFDALTGLLNRPAILERLRLAMETAAATGMPLVVALLDLDHFKKINDEFGHLGGDAVLGEVGRRLSAGIREEDQAGRYGGEELLLVLPGLQQDAFPRIEQLAATIFAEPFVFEDSPIRMSCSMGVTWMQPGDDVTSMIRRADAALYNAKRSGRDRVVFDPPVGMHAGT